MNTDQNRKEFEEWVTNELGYTIAKYDSGIYIAPNVNLALKAWQASRARSSTIYCACGNPSQHVTGWHSNLCYDCRKPIEGINPPTTDTP